MLGTSPLGFGWGVHVPLHTNALHLDRLSSEALHLEHSPGQGRGGTTAFMFLCTQKHCTLIACHLKHCTLNIVLGRIACHLKHCTLNIVLGRGGGGDKSVHVPLHTTALHLDRLSSEALHLEHSLGQGRGGQQRSCSSAHKSTAP